MSMIVACVTAKGGAGKTTLAFALATYWSSAGRRVLLVDSDPQATLTTFFGLREEQGSIGAIAVDLARFEARVKREAAGNRFDVIIIDTPSTLREIGPAIDFADVVMLPSQPSGADLLAFKQTFDVCQQRGAAVVVVPNRVKGRGQQAIIEPAFKALCEGKALIAEPIGDRVDHGAYTVDGLSIVDVDPRGKGAAEIAKLAQTLENLAQGALAAPGIAGGAPAAVSPSRRPSRSKRGVDPDSYSQICFKVPRDKHRKLKVYCAASALEIGEAMEHALDALLSSAGRRQ